MVKRVWILVASMVLLLAACSSNQQQLGAPQAPEQSAAGTPAKTAVPANGDDPFRPSDPVMVNLASGKPQLVEFFAFW